MKPVTPVIKKLKHLEVIYAKDQSQYLQLPALPVEDGLGHKRVVTRWKLSWKERILVLLFGDVYLWISTFGKPLQPLAMEAKPPEFTNE